MTVLLNVEAPTGEITSMTLERGLTGNMLKQRTFATYKKRPEEQTLWFQKPGGSLQLVDDTKTLEAHGMEDNTVIKEGRGLGNPSPERSELRRNIRDKDNFSYYYAHASETPLPDSTRYVSGGDPIPLGTSSTAPAPQIPSFRAVSEYSWSDSGDWVKIYVTQADVVALAQKEGAFHGPDYTATSVEFRVKDTTSAKAGWKFLINHLYKEIDADACKAWKVSGSKITLTLKKKETDLKWYDLKGAN